MEALILVTLAVAALAWWLHDPAASEARPARDASPGQRPVAGAARASAAPRPPAFTTHEVVLRPDAAAVAAWLAAHGIDRLYHFTDASNLASIVEQGGLLSWAACEHHGIPIPAPGGDGLSRGLDQRRSHQDHVRLSFCEDHPMKHVALREGRLRQPVLLEIDPQVLTWLGTLVADRNATDNKALVGGTLAHLLAVDPSLFQPGVRYNDLLPEDRKRFQAEVLVPTFLPARYILNWHEVAARAGRRAPGGVAAFAGAFHDEDLFR